MNGPYAEAARTYLERGYSPLPLPPGKKWSPPKGYTGSDGPMATGLDTVAWIRSQGNGNIALRLPDGVIGIDADTYKGEDERTAWNELVERLGPLPDSPRATSRDDDGASGIRLYRVPAGWKGNGVLPAGRNGVSPGEVIQHHHRYLVAPPSVHPSGKTYRWIGGHGLAVADLPDLPAAWLAGLQERPAPQPPAMQDGTADVGPALASDRPGDDYNRRADWSDILSACGAVLHHQDANGTRYWTRPGKDPRDGYSATTGHADDADRLKLFTPNWPPFEDGQVYTKLGAYALLHHSGDHSAAVRALIAQGYGSNGHKRPAPQPDIPPHPADDPAELARHRGHVAQPDAWEDPVPLAAETRPTLPKFPVKALPPWLGQMVRAVAKFHETPEDVAALAGLGVVSVATARRVRVNVAGQREEINGYFLAALDSGQRKSGPVKVMATSPLIDAIHTLQKDEDAAAQRDQREPREVRMFTTNATPAALRDLAGANGERLGIVSSEGGVFEELAGRYDRIPDLDLVLAGWNGEPYHADRATKPVPPMNRPVLTICLTVQPPVLKDMAGKPSFRDRGLLARFLYSLPEDIVGKRQNARHPIPREVSETYLRNTERLITGLYYAEAEEWTISDAAYDLFHAAEQELEPKLAKGAQYGGNDGMREWASKLMGQILKLAGLLHAAEHADAGTWPPRISEQTMRNALQLGVYFVAHAEATFGYMRTEPIVLDAESVLDWIRHIDWTGKAGGKMGQRIAAHPGKVTRREVQTGVWAIRDADHAAAVMRLLEKSGYVRQVDADRRDSAWYLLHPSLSPNSSALSALTAFDDVSAGQPANQSAEAGLCTPLHSLHSEPPAGQVQRSAEQVQRRVSALQNGHLPAKTPPKMPSAESAEEFQDNHSWPPAETGPCVRCGKPCRRYGVNSNPLCDQCRTAAPSPAEIARRIPKRQTSPREGK